MIDQNTRYYDNAHKLRFLTITSHIMTHALYFCFSMLLLYCFITDIE